MAKYLVTAPDGTELELTGPEGADQETIIAKAKELWQKSKTEYAGVPEGGIPVQPRRGGGPGYKPEAYKQSGMMQFNDDEEAAIKAASGGDPVKEHFLRLIPTIEWRNNPEGMRSKRASPVGALGPYQFMPATANTFGVRNRLDFAHSVDGAAKYYDYLNKTYNGNFKAMLADYNGGPKAGAAVMRGEDPPAAETREYLQLADKFSKAYAVDTTRREFETQVPGQAAQGGGEAVAQEQGPYVDPNMTRAEAFKEGAKLLPGAAVGVGDAALTMGTGLVGTVAGGLAGLGTLATGGGAEKAAERVKAVSDAMTWSPKSREAQNMFAALSPVLEAVDNKVKDASMVVGGGNPLAATAVETGGNALLMLIGPGAFKTAAVTGVRVGGEAGIRAGVKAGLKTAITESAPYKIHVAEAARKAQNKAIRKTAEQIMQKAKDVGVDLKLSEVHASVRAVAEGMGGEGRGADMGVLAQKLTAKHLEAVAAANKKWTDFRNLDHYANVEWAPGMVKPLAEELSADGINIMDDAIQQSFKDLEGLTTQRVTETNATGTGFKQAPTRERMTLDPVTKELKMVTEQERFKTQSLNEIQAIRKKIMNRMDNVSGSERRGLGKIGERLDEMLDAQFRADAAKGIDAPWKAWKDARETWQAYKENWNENVAVKRILEDPDMTPQKLAQEIIGTSSLLGGKQASRIYDHIVKLTGNDMNVKIAIEKSVFYDLMKPLIDNPNPTKGNFGTMANNIRKFRKENPELAKSMKLDDDFLKALQHAARVAENAQFGEAVGLFDTVKQFVIRHAVGHEIAQAGFRVRLAEKIVNKLFGVKKTSHKDMINEFAGINDEMLTSKIAKDKLAEIMIRGEVANQYQNFGEWGDNY